MKEFEGKGNQAISKKPSSSSIPADVEALRFSVRRVSCVGSQEHDYVKNDLCNFYLDALLSPLTLTVEQLSVKLWRGRCALCRLNWISVCKAGCIVDIDDVAILPFTMEHPYDSFLGAKLLWNTINVRPVGWG